VFAPIPSKESIKTFDYPINVLLQNSDNTDIGGVVVEQIFGDFTLEHKFTSFSNQKPTKMRTFNTNVPFSASIEKMWMSLWSTNVVMAKFIVKNVLVTLFYVFNYSQINNIYVGKLDTITTFHNSH
jgi:hypothetical protein